MTTVMNNFANGVSFIRTPRVYPRHRGRTGAPRGRQSPMVPHYQDYARAPGPVAASHRLLALRRLLRGLLGLELGQLLAGLRLAHLAADRLQPRVERRLGQLPAEVRLGDRRLD